MNVAQIVFFVSVTVACGVIIIKILNRYQKGKTVAKEQEFGFNATLIPFPSKVDTTLVEVLRQAEMGTLWVINQIDGHGRRKFELFVRGDLDEKQLDRLGRQNVAPFSRGNPMHKRTLLVAMSGANGVLARLAGGEDIGWAGAELIRKCDAWGICAGGIHATFNSVVASRPQIPGSTGTKEAMTRLQFILAPPKDVLPQRHDSQIFRPLS